MLMDKLFKAMLFKAKSRLSATSVCSVAKRFSGEVYKI